MPDYRSSAVLWSKVIIAGADPGIFDQGGPNFGSERTVELFWGKLLLRHTPSYQSRLHASYNNPLPVTVYLNHWTEKWISLKFAHVQTKSKICTKVVNANFAHLFAPLCEGVCRFGICHLCADFTLSLHTFAHEQI